MIIQTRYRDIPWEEVKRFHGAMPQDSADWDQMRGQPLTVDVPAIPNDTDGCGGPWFRIRSGPVKQLAFACPHLAEIGD